MGLWDRLRNGFGELVDDISLRDDVRGRLDQARRALGAGELELAERLLEEATRLAPDHSRSWMMLGATLLRHGKLDRAVAALERADAVRPGDFETLLTLARALHTRGDGDEALARAKQALGGRVTEALLDQLYGLLGEIYLERGDADRAVRELRKAVASSGGDDLELVALLGRAHYLEGNLPLARQALGRAATRTPAEPVVLELLVTVLLELDVVAEARLAALRLLEARDDVASRCLLARCLLAAGEPEQAREQLLRARGLAASDVSGAEPSAAIHHLLAEVYLAAGQPAQALEQLRIAKQLAPEPAVELLRQLADLALEDDAPPEALTEDARALLELEPDDPIGLAALAAAEPADSERAGAGARARDLAARSLASSETYAGRLSLGLAELRANRPRQAQVALRAALRLNPEGQRARGLLIEAHQRALGLEAADDAAVYPTLRRARRLLAAQPGSFEEQLGAIGALERDFDRPLLVAVMGEFNSGKSTFVNALIGEEIAPMGVTPTTATINLLKYGEQRAARVVYADDREQAVAWEDVGRFLRGLDNRQARGVRVVELLYPAEELLRVNVVDTPGLNSMIAEHEETAREFIQQADAVVWLFAADQAGKQTEQQALELIQRQRLKTVGVINKIDRLDGPQLDQVLRHLDAGFADLVEAIVPVSARRALAAMIAGDEQELGESRFGDLRALLEQRIFSRSRRIKRQACARKLVGVLEQARAAVERRLTPLAEALSALSELDAELRRGVAERDPRERQRSELRRSLEAVYREAAAEVLDFVRPRRSTLFGQHRADRADRDFLVELLEGGLARASETSCAAVTGELEATHAGLAERLAAVPVLAERQGELARVVGQQRQLLRQQVYTRFEAFGRGFLAGGRIDRFFEHELPELSLEPEAIYAALAERSLAVEAELIAPLGEWHQQTGEALRGCLDRWRHELQMRAIELDAGLRAPLDELLEAAREPHATGAADEGADAEERE